MGCPDSLTEIASAFQTADQGLVQNVETLTKTSQHDRDAIRSIATANRLVIGDHVALKTTANTVLAAINELVDEQNDLPSNAATKAEVQAVEAKVTTVRNRVDGVEPRLGVVEGDLESLESNLQAATSQSANERGLLRGDIDKNRNDILELKVQTLDSLPWAEDIAPTTDVNVGAPEARVRQLFLSGGVVVGDRVFVTQTAVLRRKDALGPSGNGGTVEGVQAFGGNTLAAWHRYYKDPTGNDIEVHNLFVVPNDFETTLAFSELGSRVSWRPTPKRRSWLPSTRCFGRSTRRPRAPRGGGRAAQSRGHVGRPAGHAGPGRTGSAGHLEGNRRGIPRVGRRHPEGAGCDGRFGKPGGEPSSARWQDWRLPWLLSPETFRRTRKA